MAEVDREDKVDQVDQAVVAADQDKDQDKPAHQETDAPAKKVITRAAPGHAQGIFGVLQSLTSGGVSTDTKSGDV